MEPNWYSKLAKSGWLGTRAQTSEEYGKPVWKPDDTKPADAMSEALKNAMKKKENQNEGGV